IALLPLYLLPLFLTRFLPGLDLPFHLAIADSLGKSQTAYESHLQLSPYVLHYLALRLLSYAMPILLAHKLVVAAYIAALPWSLARLLDACGRSRVPALLAFPLAYNMPLHYGFFSFSLSVPLLLLLLAATVRSLDEEANVIAIGIGAIALL